MRKLLTIAIIAGMTSFVACGPSASEKALKAKLDSIKKADSVAIGTTLIINCDKVNMRTTPSVMGGIKTVLNTGYVCKMIERGPAEMIKGSNDYWYKISYNGDIGWVFGTFTSLAISSNASQIIDSWVGSYGDGDGAGVAIDKDGNGYKITLSSYGHNEGPFMGNEDGGQLKFNYNGIISFIYHHNKDDRFYSKGSPNCIKVSFGNQLTYCK